MLCRRQNLTVRIGRTLYTSIGRGRGLASHEANANEDTIALSGRCLSPNALAFIKFNCGIWDFSSARHILASYVLVGENLEFRILGRLLEPIQLSTEVRWVALATFPFYMVIWMQEPLP